MHGCRVLTMATISRWHSLSSDTHRRQLALYCIILLSVFGACILLSRSHSLSSSPFAKSFSHRSGLQFQGDLLSNSFQDKYYFHPTFDPFNNHTHEASNSTSQIGQDQYAWNNFFFHMHQGTFLEIGGDDGTHLLSRFGCRNACIRSFCFMRICLMPNLPSQV